MKLALCLEYPIGQHGGTEVLVRELIRGLGSRHQILLVSPDSGESLAQSNVAGFVKEHVPWDPGAISRERSRELARRLGEAQVELAHFHFGGNYGWGCRAFDLCPIIHVRRKGIPCLSTNHGAFAIMDGYCSARQPFWVKLALFPPAWLSKQYTLAQLHCEVTVSQHDYHAVRRWYPPMRHKFRQIYHSRLHGSPEPLVPAASRVKTILCAGTIGHRKGQPLLVEAFCQLALKYPEWNLTLIGRNGEESLMRQIRDLIARHKLTDRVQWLGERTDAELHEWYRKAAIFAMPSLHEGLGLSLQEAQFNGCACVASAAGGVVDLVQNNDNGLLVPVRDVPALARALEKLMSDPELRSRLSARASKSVLEKGMTAEQMVDNYTKLYASILGA